MALKYDDNGPIQRIFIRTLGIGSAGFVAGSVLGVLASNNGFHAGMHVAKRTGAFALFFFTLREAVFLPMYHSPDQPDSFVALYPAASRLLPTFAAGTISALLFVPITTGKLRHRPSRWLSTGALYGLGCVSLHLSLDTLDQTRIKILWKMEQRKKQEELYAEKAPVTKELQRARAFGAESIQQELNNQGYQRPSFANQSDYLFSIMYHEVSTFIGNVIDLIRPIRKIEPEEYKMRLEHKLSIVEQEQESIRAELKELAKKLGSDSSTV